MTSETSVDPSALDTFTETRLARGATPDQVPPDMLPSPAMIPAMWVPWPKWSSPSRSGVRSTRARTRFPRSAVWLTPVSNRATVTPAPESAC